MICTLFCKGLFALKAHAPIFLLLEEIVAVRAAVGQKKADTIRRHHFDTQALKLQYACPSSEAPSTKRDSVGYAVVLIMLSSGLGLFPPFSSLPLPCPVPGPEL